MHWLHWAKSLRWDWNRFMFVIEILYLEERHSHLNYRSTTNKVPVLSFHTRITTGAPGPEILQMTIKQLHWFPAYIDNIRSILTIQVQYRRFQPGGPVYFGRWWFWAALFPTWVGGESFAFWTFFNLPKMDPGNKEVAEEFLTNSKNTQR